MGRKSTAKKKRKRDGVNIKRPHLHNVLVVFPKNEIPSINIMLVDRDGKNSYLLAIEIGLPEHWDRKNYQPDVIEIPVIEAINKARMDVGNFRGKGYELTIEPDGQ